MTLPDYHVLYDDGSAPHSIPDNRLCRRKDKGHKKAICSGQTRKAVTDSTGMLSYSLYMADKGLTPYYMINDTKIALFFNNSINAHKKGMTKKRK
jgi:hypothetical protein